MVDIHTTGKIHTKYIYKMYIQNIYTVNFNAASAEIQASQERHQQFLGKYHFTT